MVPWSILLKFSLSTTTFCISSLGCSTFMMLSLYLSALFSSVQFAVNEVSVTFVASFASTFTPRMPSTHMSGDGFDTTLPFLALTL